MNFVIKIEPEALQDIQEAIDWYELQKGGLGEKFYDHLEMSMKSLESNPYFQVRYTSIRCLPLNIFPYMIHFSIDETKSIVIVRAVFNTARNPEKWKGRL